MKKRLVGAFVLIGFAVVVLPALLGGEGPQDAAQQDPMTLGPDAKVFVSKITPIGGATPQPLPAPDAPPAPEVEKTPAAPGASDSLQRSSIEADEAVPTAGADRERAPDTATPAAQSDGPGWVVRVGTFAKKDNVDRVVERLRQAGFEPSTTSLGTESGTVMRVWIGPYAKRVEAARMRARVRQVTGGEGYIAAYP